jgi:hypothetical protein
MKTDRDRDLGEKRKREDNESDGKKNVKKAKTVTTIESVKKTTESRKKTKTVLNSNWDKIKVRILRKIPVYLWRKLGVENLIFVWDSGSDPEVEEEKSTKIRPFKRKV